jgi:FMN-dependent NADH-azoreductase
MSLYRLDTSIRVQGSHSRAIADIVEQERRRARPVIQSSAVTWVLTRSRQPLGRPPYLPAAHPESLTEEQQAALALASTLADELIAADALLFAVPLYNFGVSQHFKTWVDMVITDPRMAAGAEPVLVGKPAVLVTVRGGNYRPGTPREGWDHATGWMRRILADVWHLDLGVVETDFTSVGVNPALDQFKGLAHQLRREAEEQARHHGRELAAAVAITLQAA